MADRAGQPLGDALARHARALGLGVLTLAIGGAGFLLKDSPPQELARGIRVVAGGDALLAPSVTRRLITHLTATRAANDASRTARTARQAVGRLTEREREREREVLAHLARGLTNGEIARTAYVSESTVKTHVGRIFAKLGVNERVQAAVVAYDAGLVLPGSDGRPGVGVGDPDGTAPTAGGVSHPPVDAWAQPRPETDVRLLPPVAARASPPPLGRSRRSSAPPAPSVRRRRTPLPAAPSDGDQSDRRDRAASG